MISRLIDVLQQKGLLLSDQEIDALSEAQSLLHDEDIADALWLASKIGGSYEIEQVDESGTPKDLDTTPPIQVIDDITVPDALPPSVSAYIPQTAKSEPSSIKTPEQGLPIQVQAAPALAHPRDIGRSLRPLMSKVPSLTRSQLDEVATVNRIAERDVWVPILKPLPERWFDLELVIEASKLSFIWQDTLDEFQHLLECQGAFRNVRTWYVHESNTGQLKLVSKKQDSADISQDQTSRSHKELVDASGRRLVLFVSDCRSQLWQTGQIHDWLNLWSQHGPTAIVQLLPERLWDQSELDVGFAVQVSSFIPGAPNPKLQVRGLPIRTEIAPVDALTVPVVTLAAGALKQWALVVSAVGRQRCPARLFDLSWVKNLERDRTRAVIRPNSAKERVELFRATASPLAQRLASMMAAVPVELSVVHLIQQELLKDLQPVHIAEVYSSGLLEEIKPNQSKSDAPVQYDFVKEVRGLLNETTPLDETLGVLEALSQRIARTLGFEIRSFTALLSPKSSWSQEAKDAILPFAQIATEVLHRLGGDYAELAQLVERDAQDRHDWIQPIEPSLIDPELKILDFTTAQFVDPETNPEADNSFPPIQTEQFAVMTVTVMPAGEARLIDLQPFTFTVATIERDSAQQQRSRESLQQGVEWMIQHQTHTAYHFLEPLTPTGDVFLDMVKIPGGTFVMGSSEDEPDRRPNESLQHSVTVKPFFIAKTPITQLQWHLVATRIPKVQKELTPDLSRFQDPARPIEKVSWYNAVEFCVRLSHHTGRIYRLPTEAEWEYACRAGTETPFHFGETITPELASYAGTFAYNDGPTGGNRQETTPVNHFGVANAWGLSDMHGNVREWCQDHWHSNYEGAPTDGNAWLSENEKAFRVLRGGSWINHPKLCRSASRDNGFPRNSDSSIGFRVVCQDSRFLA
jgi:formylglycine-generating enzyme required for sulfatase activity